MKTRILLLALAIASRASFAADTGAEPPPGEALSRASVTIPYSELRALWEAAHTQKSDAAKPEPAPVAHLVSRADVRLQLGESASVVEAVFDVEVLEPKWQSIPLLGGDARLEKAEAGDRAIVWQDGYKLLASERGKTTATLHLAAPGVKQLQSGRGILAADHVNRGKDAAATFLQLNLTAATVKRLTISGLPDGLEARVDDKPASTISGGTASFHLPSEAGPIRIELAAPRVERPPEPSVWEAQSQVLVRFAEERLQFQARVFARTDAGSGTEFFLTLPANASGVSVKGDDLAESATVRADDGQRLVRVRWQTPDVLDRELSLSYSIPQSPLAEQWPLRAPATIGGEESRHLFAVAVPDGLELKGNGVRPAVDAQRLPAWVRAELKGATFVTAEGGPRVDLQARWLPTVGAADAVVTEAKSELRLVTDGSLRTAATWTIRHAAPLAWRLDLPADVELLECTVAGRAARPVQREQGALEISLPAPDAKSGVTSVALVFAARAEPLDPVSGKVALALPRTALFVERLLWSVALPDAFEITAISGNVAVAAGGRRDAERGEQIISLRKDLCRGERPAVELFYQRRGLNK